MDASLLLNSMRGPARPAKCRARPPLLVGDVVSEATSKLTRSLSPASGGALAGGLDGAVVRVEADDLRAGIGIGQQQRRRPVAAADVGDPRPPERTRAAGRWPA